MARVEVVSLLVLGALGWGTATGVAVADVAGLGPRGIQGPPGVSGEAGVVGVVGPVGPAGARGPQGPAGPASKQAGEVGPRGVKGARGDVGAKGPDYAPTDRPIFQRSQSGNFQGEVMSVRAARMTVNYRYDCPGPAPSLSLTWEGSPTFDYGNVWLPGRSGSGTQYLNPRTTSGFFKVVTQDTCTWSITVTQLW